MTGIQSTNTLDTSSTGTILPILPTDRDIRIATAQHIVKTIKTLSLQFLFTFSCILLVTFVNSIRYFMIRYLLHIFGLGIAGSILTVIFMMFSNKKTETQLGLFTIFETMTICTFSLMFGQTTITLGLLITIGLTAGLACYALTTKDDFASYGLSIHTALAVLCAMGFLNLFLRAPLLHIIGMYFGIMLFCVYIIYDVQLYLTEKCSDIAVADDDLYIIASLQIYLDVVNILIRIWELIALLTGNKKQIK